MDYDQLFKAVLIAQLRAFFELFFPSEAARLDLARARFVDKELFTAPPMGPGREVDLLAEVPLLAPGGSVGSKTGGALVAIHIEVQAQREPGFIWRNLEYYAILRRLLKLPVFPIAFFPLVDVLGQGRGRRPSTGYERVTQHDEMLGHNFLQYEFLAVTLRALDAGTYLARPQALAGALAALMRRPARMLPGTHKLACLRRIMDGDGADPEETRQLLANVVETCLPLTGADAEQFEQLLRQPENEGVRQTMKTWLEQHEEIAAIRKAQEDVLRVLEARFGPVPPEVAARVRQVNDEAALGALLTRAATAPSLAAIDLP